MELRGIEVTVKLVKNTQKLLYAATATKGGMEAHSIWNENPDDAAEHAVWQIEHGYAKPVQPKTGKQKPDGDAELFIGNLDEFPEYYDWRSC